MGSVVLVVSLSYVTNMGVLRASATTVTLGVNYGQLANNLPPPQEVVHLIGSVSLTKSKLYDTNATVLSAFKNTGISFVVGTLNSDLLPLAQQSGYADAWINTNIMSFYPNTTIIGIVVGNEIFTSATDEASVASMASVLPAMLNVYAALRSRGLQNQIFVSTAHAFSTLSASYPPSAGAFHPSIANAYMKPVLQFLSETGAPFMINVYPFFAYKADPATVALEYVLFQTNAGILDPTTGLRYYNMFDAQMDAVYTAISALGFNNITLLVSETGWPSLGGDDEPGATLANAQTYHTNLVQHLASKSGTPLRPDKTPEIYLFALFNENQKPGPVSERNYGLFWPNGTKVYNFDFTTQASSSSSSSSLRVSDSTPRPFTFTLLLLLVQLLVRPFYNSSL